MADVWFDGVFDHLVFHSYQSGRIPKGVGGLVDFCVGGSPYPDPPECGHGTFLSLRTPTRDDPTIFWTASEGSHQFRVLWREGGQDEEIARCEIGAGTCEVFLP